jgi:hypothetical protein
MPVRQLRNHMIKWNRNNIGWSLPLIAGVIGVAYSCYISSGVFFVPRGSYIRPMGPAFAVFIDAAILFLIGFLPGLVGMFKSSLRKITALVAVLCLLPYPCFICITKIGIVLRDLHLSD